MTLSVELRRLDDTTHSAQFTFRRFQNGWQLVVPDHVVEAYGTELTGKLGPSPAS